MLSFRNAISPRMAVLHGEFNQHIQWVGRAGGRDGNLQAQKKTDYGRK